MSNSPVGVRIATAEDLRFVASTWFRSVLESNTVVNQVPFGIFRDGMEANIQRLLKRAVTRVVFATSQPDELLGYVVGFLQRAHKGDERYTVRDGINVARYALKLVRGMDAHPITAFRQALFQILGEVGLSEVEP